MMSRGGLLALLAMVLFSSKAIVVKLLHQYGLGAEVILSYRLWLAFPFYSIAIFVLFKQGHLARIPPRYHVAMALMGFAGYYGSALLDFWGLEYIDASVERILLFSYPVYVLLLEAILQKTMPSKAQVLSIVLCYSGVIGMVLTGADGNSLHLENKSVQGMLLVLASALSFSFFVYFSKPIIAVTGSLSFASLSMAWSTVWISIHRFTIPVANLNSARDTQAWLLIILLALGCTVIPSVLYAFALKKVRASFLATTGMIGPVVTAVLGVVVLGEQLRGVQIFFGGVIIAGVAMAQYAHKK